MLVAGTADREHARSYMGGDPRVGAAMAAKGEMAAKCLL